MNEKVKGLAVGIVITTGIFTIIKNPIFQKAATSFRKVLLRKFIKTHYPEKCSFENYKKDHDTLLSMYRCASRYMNGYKREMTDEGMSETDRNLHESFEDYYKKNSEIILKNCYENTGHVIYQF